MIARVPAHRPRRSSALKNLKIITFGPRPQDFFACNAPIKGLYELGVEIEENSELDLLVAYKAHENDPRIAEVCSDMADEMGEGTVLPGPDRAHGAVRADAAGLGGEPQGRAPSTWPSPTSAGPPSRSQFGFEPCYVNSRLAARGIPVACEVDIYGALSEYIGTVRDRRRA